MKETGGHENNRGKEGDGKVKSSNGQKASGWIGDSSLLWE
jgi:hypothetical protein